MKWPVHDHDLYDRSPSQHTEEQLLVSLVTALFSSSISFASPLFTNKLSLSNHSSFQLMSLSYVCFHPTKFLLFFLQHNPLQFVLIWQIVSPLPTPLFYQGIISRYALWRKAPCFVSYSLLFSQFLHQFFRHSMYSFFFLQTVNNTFAIQYQPPTFSLRQ